MNCEDAEEFTQSLGQIVAGSWRQLALAEKMGVPKALGLSLQDWVTKRLGGYVRLSISERREAAIELVEGGMSKRKAAEILGVSHPTIIEDLSGKNLPQEGAVSEKVGDQGGKNLPVSPDNGQIVHGPPVTSQFRRSVENKFERWLMRWDRDNDVALIVKKYCTKRAPTRWVSKKPGTL